jgi:hypothetical protein
MISKVEGLLLECVMDGIGASLLVSDRFAVHALEAGKILCHQSSAECEGPDGVS